jgi:signal transduction histidine kinase
VGLDPETDPAITALMQTGRPRQALPMQPRRRWAEGAAAALFLAVALAVALAADAERDWDIGRAVVLTLLFGVATRVSFDIGAGFTNPVQLAFVPMLLLLPTPWVPLLVAAAYVLSRLPDVLRREAHPDRLVVALADAWFAVGPVLVLVAFDAQTPEWSDWPVYMLALLAQFLFDLVNGQLREWFGRGIAPDLQLRAIVFVQSIDALLSPLGLLAAFASASFEYAFLLLVPAAGLLFFYSGERSRRLQNALALADAARERQELIAGASHELVTPVAVLHGITDRLDGDMSPERRAEMHAAMRRELAQLRHRVRQFVDYTRLKTDRELRFQPRDTDVAEIAHDVARAFAAEAGVQVEAPLGLVRATVDPDRLQQMLMSLVANAVKLSPPGSPVRITAAASGTHVEVAVIDRGPGIPPEGVAALFAEGRPATDGAPEGAGLGLYLVRELVRAHGGEVRVDTERGRGSRFTLVLPSAK